jgi:hypothetical protein
MATPHNPGLVVHHDPNNDKYLVKDTMAKRPLAAGGPVVWTPTTRRHRQYATFDQGQTPECTGYGSVTLLATADPYNKPPLTGHDWYLKNVAFDRAAGRFYDGGATVTAAMEVGRGLGFWDVYRWMYEVRTMQEAIVRAPLIAGTYWYTSMFERDKEGIVADPGPAGSIAGGHLYTINGYDAERDLWRVPNTWNDGIYWIPGSLMLRLVREEGEIAQPDEIKIVKKKAA